MWFIGVEVEQETSAPPPKKNPGSAPAMFANFSGFDFLRAVSTFRERKKNSCLVLKHDV